MRLIKDWKWVATKAWSTRLIVIAGFFSGLEVALNVMSSYSVNPRMPSGLFAAFSGVVTVIAFFTRFIAQRDES